MVGSKGTDTDMKPWKKDVVTASTGCMLFQRWLSILKFFLLIYKVCCVNKTLVWSLCYTQRDPSVTVPITHVH